MKSFLIRLVAFGVFLAAVLEIVFRTLVPAAAMPAGYQDRENGIMALTPAGAEGRHSIGRFGRPAYRWRVNNYGFNSEWDYVPAAERGGPCAVIVGSSYAQGLYSDAEDHLAGRLQALLPGVDCYNLASSGMPFSQAPVVLDFAQREFAPDVVVLFAGANDVANSIRNLGTVPYCRQYMWRDGELAEAPPSPFRVNRLKRLLRHSATVRYLYHNANYNLGGGGMVQAAAQQKKAPDDDTELLRAAAARAAAEVRDAAPGARIVVVQDADRAAMERGGEKPPRLRNSLLMEEACRAEGILFVDMTDVFWSELQSQGRRFDFSDNYHWNPYAVDLAARAVAAALRADGLGE